MPLSEQTLIERFFRAVGAQRGDVGLGVGDDAALLRPAPGQELVVTTDTLVAGVHFPPDCPAAAIGHRALAVNLSDIAAMGAEPCWALLALTLPQADAAWLAEFAAGLGTLAREHGVALVGGDTTRGPLCITVQLLGQVPPGRALRRDGAHAGDALFVSGTPGDAAAGLALVQRRLEVPPQWEAGLRERFLYPTPRLALGAQLREFASACIDVSDGLLGDAGKLAAASGLGARLEWEALPVSEGLGAACGAERARVLALTGGDDYELCFAVPPERVSALHAALPPARWGYARIGTLEAAAGARVMREGTVMEFSHSGYQHFR
ncbi:MAG: thiamine-phosphate kinase [Gammaproteobacteria bacterium]|nr:thiamine-phosphate kinase [Gammaproteobacteria bacterium]